MEQARELRARALSRAELAGEPQVERVVVLADLQIPYDNEPAVSAAMAYIHDSQPDKVILLGDILDFPSFTTKFARKNADPYEVLTQIEQGAEVISRVHRSAPRADIVFVEGNHEARLANYIVECAPELSALTEHNQPLSVPALLVQCGAPNRFDYVGPYSEPYIHNSFVFKHGEAVGVYPARKELDMEGSSGMSGHVHRFQQYSRTDRSGAHTWHTIGALCNVSGPDTPPSYLKGRNRLHNWQQGFATVFFSPNGTFNVYPTVIIDGHFTSPDGILYGPDGAVLA